MTLLDAKQELIAGWETRHQKNLAIFRAVSPHTVAHPESGWTAKDLVTHLTGWEQVSVESVEAFINGIPYELPAAVQTVEEFNQSVYHANKDLPAEMAFAHWEQMRDRLKAAIHAFPDDKFDQPFTSPWGFVTITNLIKGIGIHEKLHTGEVTAAAQ